MATRSKAKKRPAAKKRRPATRKKATRKKTTRKKTTRKKTTRKKTTRKKTTRKKTTRKKTTRKKATRKKTTRKKTPGASRRPRKPVPRQPAPADSTPPAQPVPPANGAPGANPPPKTAPAGKPGQVGGAAGIRVRMYRVGFGDFFLLSLRGTDGTVKHILVDCGVHAANLGTIGTAINQLAEDTGKQLALVIMTHHHADHISGFATGKDDFKDFNVEAVWMPWFEDPKDATATAFQANITAVATHLQLQLAAAGRQNDQYHDMAENITGVLTAAGGSNDVAMATLRGGFANPVTPTYYKAGDPANLPESLVKIGLTAKILGPPGPDQLDLVAQMDNNTYQYLAGGDTSTDAPPARLNPAYIARNGKDAYPPEAFKYFTAANLEKRVGLAQPDVLAAQAQKADNSINNQSLVVFFTFGGKTMLFAGDAQWGNWDNFLFDGATVDDTTQLTGTAKAILGNLDFYKVGHHGSRNATPKPAVAGIRNGAVAMCSTQPGAYGSPAKNTEVPQGKLLAALQAKTHFVRSDQVGVSGSGVELDQSDPKQATDTTDAFDSKFFVKDDVKGYIDYNM